MKTMTDTQKPSAWKPRADLSRLRDSIELWDPLDLMYSGCVNTLYTINLAELIWPLSASPGPRMTQRFAQRHEKF